MQTRPLGAVNSNVDLLVLREKAAMTSRLKFCRIKNTVRLSGIQIREHVCCHDIGSRTKCNKLWANKNTA